MWKQFPGLILDIFNYFQEGELPLRPDLINLTANWVSPDTFENYKKQGNQSFAENSIIYRYNSHGWRTHEFERKENTILCFGCSITEGIGLNKAWPEMLQEFLPEYSFYNLGHSGGSSDTISRLVINCLLFFKPVYIMILWPSQHRFETYTDDETPNKYSRIVHNGIWDLSEKKTSASAINFLNDTNSYNRYYKNKLLVDLISKKHQCRVISVDFIDEIVESNFFMNYSDRARDGSHPGTSCQSYIANEFLKKLKNDKSPI